MNELASLVMLLLGTSVLWLLFRPRRVRTPEAPPAPDPVEPHFATNADVHAQSRVAPAWPETLDNDALMAMRDDGRRESARAEEFRRNYLCQPPPPKPERDAPIEIHGRDWLDTGGFSFAYGSDGAILLQHLRTAGLRNRMVVQATKVRVHAPGILELDVRAARSSSDVSTFVMLVPVGDIPVMLRAVDEAVDAFARSVAAGRRPVFVKMLEGPKL